MLALLYECAFGLSKIASQERDLGEVGGQTAGLMSDQLSLCGGRVAVEGKDVLGSSVTERIVQQVRPQSAGRASDQEGVSRWRRRITARDIGQVRREFLHQTLHLACVIASVTIGVGSTVGTICLRMLIRSIGAAASALDQRPHRMRDAVQSGWPQPLELVEHSHAAMANAYEAGAAGLPLAVLRGYIGSDLPMVNDQIKFIECPFTGERLAAVPSVRPDVTVIHAQKADREGNVMLEGIVGVQKEAVLASKRSLVTVEEIVDELGPRSFNACVLPHWTVTAIAVVPGGAHPSYAQGRYKRDNAFYEAWDAISRDRDSFKAWIEAHVMKQGPEVFAAYAGRAA